MKAVHKQTGSELITAIESWNKEITLLKEIGEWKDWTEAKAASFPTIQHILEQSYGRACADDASILNVYEGKLTYSKSCFLEMLFYLGIGQGFET